MTKNEIIEKLESLGVVLTPEEKRQKKNVLEDLLKEKDFDPIHDPEEKKEEEEEETPEEIIKNENFTDDLMGDILNGGGVVEDKTVIEEEAKEDDKVEKNEPIIEVEKKPRKKRTTRKSKNELQVEGAIILAVIDFAFPTAIAAVAKIIGYQVSADSLMLDEGETERLMPYANNFAESLSLNLNPMTAFALMAALAYMPKAFIVISKADKIKKVKR